MRLLHLEGLCHVDVVAHLDPLLYPLADCLLLLLAVDALVFLRCQDGIFLLEDRIGRRVESIEGVLLEGSAIYCIIACLNR